MALKAARGALTAASKSGRFAPTAVALVRFGYGATLLTAPGVLIRLAGAQSAGPGAKRVARVLGARHCLQAVLLSRSRAPIAHELGVTVDLLHALSMQGMAAFDRTHRQAEVVDSCVATAFASAEMQALRGAR